MVVSRPNRYPEKYGEGPIVGLILWGSYPQNAGLVKSSPWENLKLVVGAGLKHQHPELVLVWAGRKRPCPEMMNSAKMVKYLSGGGLV